MPLKPVNIKTAAYLSSCILASSVFLTAWSDPVGQSEMLADCAQVPLFSVSSFEPASAELPINSLHLLTLVAERLKDKACVLSVTGYGSQATGEIQTETRDIGTQRAQAVADFLVDQGADPAYLLVDPGGSVSSFGPPSSNRRVTVAFTPERGLACSHIASPPPPQLEIVVSAFLAGSTELTEGAKLDVETFANLSNRPECNIIVQAYASVEGADQENQKLSINRAIETAKGLSAFGIAQERISLRPMGATEIFGEDFSTNRRAVINYR